MLSLLQKLTYSFSKTKVKVNMCGACSYGRDYQFLKHEIWKLDPYINVQAQRLKQIDGKFEIILEKENQQPRVIFDAKLSGRISPFNIASVLKQIRDW